MNVSLLVCTYGSDEWERRGRDAFDHARTALAPLPDGCEVRRLHLPAGTLAEARNQAAASANGDWVTWLDADDELAPGYLDAMATSSPLPGEAFEGEYLDKRPWLLVPAVQYARVSDHGATGYLAAPEIPAWDRPLIDVNSCVIGTLIPRALFLELGGFRELPSLEDWDLTLRAVKAGARLVAVPDAVYVAHVRGDGRNADQSPYAAIRAEHEHGFPWHDLASYKIGAAQ